MTHRQEIMVGIQTLSLIAPIVTNRDPLQSGHCPVEWPPPQSETEGGVVSLGVRLGFRRNLICQNINRDGEVAIK